MRSKEIQEWILHYEHCVENKIYLEAIDWLEKIYQSSNEQIIWILQLAQLYEKTQNRLKAIQVLLEFSIRHPNSETVLFALGTLYFLDKNFQFARRYFESAIQLKPNYVDAYYYLGLVELSEAQFVRARSAFHAVLELDSFYFAAKFQLGLMAMRTEDFRLAQRYFFELHQQFPSHYETLVNLATSYFQLSQFELAQQYYEKAIQENAQDTQSLFNLGVLSEKRQDWILAEYYYRCILDLNPTYPNAHHNLGVLYLKQNHRELALIHFLLAEENLPQAQRTHLIAMLKGENLPRASREYVEQLFEGYAPKYEAHLTQVLQYQVPKILYDLVQLIKPNFHWRLLDLGCGTGLAANYFRDQIQLAIGVDLSESMLNQAKAKGIYHKLHQQDIVDFLSSSEVIFNLVLAADVLVYFGELESILADIAKVLESGGLFAFNIEAEKMKSSNYRLSSTGRFIHDSFYIESILQTLAFSIEKKQEIVLRENQGEAVLGLGYILMKK